MLSYQPADLCHRPQFKNVHLTTLLENYEKLHPNNFPVINLMNNLASDLENPHSYGSETEVDEAPLHVLAEAETFPKLPHVVDTSSVPISMAQVLLFNDTADKVLLNLHKEGFLTPIGSRFERGSGIRLNAAVSVHFQTGLGLMPTEFSIFHQERFQKPNSTEQVKIYYLTSVLREEAFELALAHYPHSYAVENKGLDQSGKLPLVLRDASSISDNKGRLSYLVPMAIMHLRTPFEMRSLD